MGKCNNVPVGAYRVLQNLVVLFFAFLELDLSWFPFVLSLSECMFSLVHKTVYR